MNVQPLPVKPSRAVMPLMSRKAQQRIVFDVKVHRLKVALEQIQRSVAIYGNSITRAFTSWRESLERSGIDVDALIAAGKLKGVRYEKPVIIDDPPPVDLSDFKIELRNHVQPVYSPAAQQQIAATSARILAELGPGPGRDA